MAAALACLAVRQRKLQDVLFDLGGNHVARKAQSGRQKPIDAGPGGPSGGKPTGGTSLWFAAPPLVAPYVERFMAQMQRMETEALDDVRRDVSIEIDEARTAPPHQALSLQVELVTLELTRLGRMTDQVLAGIFDAQAGWLRDLEAYAADMVLPWLGDDERTTVSSAEPVLELPLQLTPAAWLAGANSACREITKAWLGAIAHDVQIAPADESTMSWRTYPRSFIPP